MGPIGVVGGVDDVVKLEVVMSGSLTLQPLVLSVHPRPGEASEDV